LGATAAGGEEGGEAEADSGAKSGMWHESYSVAERSREKLRDFSGLNAQNLKRFHYE
jgi:hypothetical protein